MGDDAHALADTEAELRCELRCLENRYDLAKQNAKAYAREAREIRLSGAINRLRTRLKRLRKEKGDG